MHELRQKRAKTALSIILAVLFLAVGFVGGYFTYYFTLDEGIRRIIWTKNQISDKYYEEISDDALYNAALDGMAGLLDAYSEYYTEEEYASVYQQRLGQNYGVGLTVQYKPEGVFIYRVGGNSPAERAGIRAGMYILEMGDSLDTLQAVGEDFSERLAGYQENEPFWIRTDHGDFQVAREQYATSYVSYRSATSSYTFTGEDALTPLRGEDTLPLGEDTAYIRITQFGGNLPEQFATALSIFRSEGRTNLILDLRNNGGGTLSTLCKVAKYLCKTASGRHPVILNAKYRSGKIEAYCSDESEYASYFSEESEIFVLANYNTASASECLMGAMLDYGTISYDHIYLSEIGGIARSYGKGIMQTTYENFLYGGAIKLTTATVHWPKSDTCIHDRGILPEDGALTVPAENAVTYADEELTAATERILARLS